VPLVDIDIEPDLGSVNPFRVGADRTATNRHYHAYFELGQGNAVDLNEARNPGSMQESPIAYRTPGNTSNTRVIGPFRYSGAYGCGNPIPGHLWFRYYAPDHDVDVLGGVPLPKAHYELSTGEQFWLGLEAETLTKLRRRFNVPMDFGPFRTNEGPRAPFGSERGWVKLFGIQLAVTDDLMMLNYPFDLFNEPLKAALRWLDWALLNRGQNQPPPANYEASSTTNHYTTYLWRHAMIEPGHVLVLTGKLPTFPRTRNGEPVMEAAEVRYWGVDHMNPVHTPENWVYILAEIGSLMDDQVATNEDGRYIIVFSRPEDRPSNAFADYGVTWENWGWQSWQTMVLRWTSVMPEWHLPDQAPDVVNIPWRTGEWSSFHFDGDAGVWGNEHNGARGGYQPVVHYMTAGEFEALGNVLDPSNIPIGDDW
jgi:hypothetical protein